MTGEQSVVAIWNEVALTAIREGSAQPTITSDQLFMIHTSIYDAWAAYDLGAYGLYSQLDRPSDEHSDVNKAEAVSHAAYTALVELFASRKPLFDEVMNSLGYETAPAQPSTAARVGQIAAESVFLARSTDGSNRDNGYVTPNDYDYTPVNSSDPEATGSPNFDPNHWQPLRVPTGSALDENGIPVITGDPASYRDQTVLTPYWGSVTPFALSSGDALRPDAPPKFGDSSVYVDALGNVSTGDQAYRDQFGEVLEASANLTTEQKLVAEFWADGPRTESPPGHWNQIAQDIALREGHGIDEDAKFFMALNAALFDAGVATWESKNHYDYIRPQSAIRYLYDGQQVEAWAGPNLGTQLIDGSDWRPYQETTFVSPPFQEFTSGHSSFSYAAAETIASFVGDDTYYDGVSVGNYDLDLDGEIDLLGEYISSSLAFEEFPESEDAVTLRWDTVFDAAAEAGVSRIYGGIHIQDGDYRGRELGSQVASVAETHWQSLFSRAGDDVITADADGGVIYAGTGDDVVTGLAGDDVIKPGLGFDEITTGAGADRISGTAAELNGIGVTDLSARDRIIVEDVALETGDVTWTPADGALAFDTDGDGETDVEIELLDIPQRAVFSTLITNRNTEISYDVPDGPGGPDFLLVIGTQGSDRVRGSDANERFELLGGAIDGVEGFGGIDIYAFADQQGQRDSLRVLEFDVQEDRLDLGDAEILSTTATAAGLTIRIDNEDRDYIFLGGVSDIDAVTLVEQEPELPVILGQAGISDRITGTDVAERIDGLGGPIDGVRGGGGADIFTVTDFEGLRDSLRLLDYEAGLDRIDLNGTDIRSIAITEAGAHIRLDNDDRDAVFVADIYDAEDLTFLNDLTFS